VDGFRVSTAGLDHAAGAAGAAAEALRAADLTGPVRGVAAAMPGGGTAAMGAELAARWAAACADTADAIARQSAALASTAAAYRASEDASTSAFAGVRR
jgi:hypothetical protein